MKKMLIVMLLLVSMVSVFGQEIPWGVSKEEIVPNYISSLEIDKHYFSEVVKFQFCDSMLFTVSYVLMYKSEARTLSQFFIILDKLTEKYGEPEFIKTKYQEIWKWETEREEIELETYFKEAIKISFTSK